MSRTPTEIAVTARAMIALAPALEAPMRAEWAKVEEAISAHASASKKKWKVYEVHHLTQHARLAMLSAFVDGKAPEQCAVEALKAAGI